MRPRSICKDAAGRADLQRHQHHHRERCARFGSASAILAGPAARCARRTKSCPPLSSSTPFSWTNRPILASGDGRPIRDAGSGRARCNEFAARIRIQGRRARFRARTARERILAKSVAGKVPSASTGIGASDNRPSSSAPRGRAHEAPTRGRWLKPPVTMIWEGEHSMPARDGKIGGDLAPQFQSGPCLVNGKPGPFIQTCPARPRPIGRLPAPQSSMWIWAAACSGCRAGCRDTRTAGAARVDFVAGTAFTPLGLAPLTKMPV